jgi:NAD(P)-dependent dehydrogenase (short-subunit alcohol dehydrogenase family)
MGRLDGKVALITGAAGGMGLAASKLFVEEGARVVMTDVAEDAGRAAAGEIGRAAAFTRADVSTAADAEAMVRFAVETFGGLHVVYNNAGVVLPNDVGVVETDEETWDRTMSINLKGVWLGCKFGIPAIIESGGGSIINVASFVAMMGAATAQIAYTATKGGVLSMTREIAVEYARRGVRANALCPGPIETPLLLQLFADEAAKQRRLVHVPMGRLGQAEEVVRAALWLASDESSFMTGAAMVVDGGITSAYVTPE